MGGISVFRGVGYGVGAGWLADRQENRSGKEVSRRDFGGNYVDKRREGGVEGWKWTGDGEALKRA